MINKHNSELKFRKSRKIFKIILILFIVFLIFFTAVFSAYIFNYKGNIAEATIDIAENIAGTQNTIYCLLLGVSEVENANLTDTIMLVGYNPNSQKAFIMSIPRDTYIGKNRKMANGLSKINSLYQKDVEKVLEVVRNLTKIDVSEYIVIKTRILRDLVDSIGGVAYDVPIKMDYDDVTQNLHIHLNKGRQILDGKKAEELVRFRHNNSGTSYSVQYGDNDFGRMRTQREFLKCLVTQIIQIDSITKIKGIATAIFDNVKTNIALKKIFSYIPYGIRFDTENLKMVQLPGNSVQINNIWFFEADNIKTEQVVKEMLDYIQ